MEFVVVVLQEFFSKDREGHPDHAEDPPGRQRRLRRLFRDVAATKVDQVLEAAPRRPPAAMCQ
jgi:ATP-dependent Clp protease adapter protein ClpS